MRVIRSASDRQKTIVILLISAVCAGVTSVAAFAWRDSTFSSVSESSQISLENIPAGKATPVIPEALVLGSDQQNDEIPIAAESSTPTPQSSSSSDERSGSAAETDQANEVEESENSVQPVAASTPSPTPSPALSLTPIMQPAATPAPTVILTPVPTPVPTQISNTVVTSGEVSYVNSLRAGLGRSSLQSSGPLQSSAQSYAQYLANGCKSLSHSDISLLIGIQLGTGVSIAAAENVAYNSTIQANLQGFTGSPGHYANMVGSFTHIGVASVSAGDPACAGRIYTVMQFARI